MAQSGDPIQQLSQRVAEFEQESDAPGAAAAARDESAAIDDNEPFGAVTRAAVFDDREADVDEARIQQIVESYMARRQSVAYNDADADAVQDQKISTVEKNLNAFIAKAGQVKYPNATLMGVFQADMGFFHQDATSRATYGPIQDGADFRRARLGAKGSVTESTNYFFQMDFGFFGRPTFTDVWVEQTGIPILGNVRIGQWKQPFSLEVVSSFRYTTFMERSVLFQPFTPFRRLGIGFYDHSEDLSLTWAASAFRSGQDQFGNTLATDGGWGTAERITWLPCWDEASGGKDYLHLGLGHFFNAPPRDSINFRTIPEFFIGQNANGVVGTSGQAVPGGLDGTPFFVKTGPLAVHTYNVIGTELLWVRGPLSLQSEAMVNFVNQDAGPALTLPGVYAQAGYFLTGEHRPYDRKAGAIDRVMPTHSVRFCGQPGVTDPGWGAWEVAARFSYLSLKDKNVNGGTLADFTLGVNWFLNPYTKIVFNYIRATPDDPVFGTSHTDMFGMRTQLDF